MGGKRGRAETQITLGAKVRFLQEGPHVPTVGTFPLLELPVGDADKGLGSSRLHGLVPLWLQKGGSSPRRAASAANDARAGSAYACSPGRRSPGRAA